MKNHYLFKGKNWNCVCNHRNYL